jgi:methyl-accepting chemotaxis protein/cytochrome b561
MTYSRPLRMVHWTIAILVTCQLAIAVVLTQLRSLAYGQLVLSLHRQLGLVILLLVIARLAMIRRDKRVGGSGFSGPGSGGAGSGGLSNSLPSWQVRAATLVHGAFYLVLVAQPVVGILVAWARGDTVGLFGLLQISAPVEMSDALRERLMTVHTVTAIALFSLCLVHVGAVVFNRVVRGVSVIDRMLAPIPDDKLVNRIPIAAQLSLAFGLVIGIALVVGINAVATYRDLSRATEAFQSVDIAVADQLHAAQVAWKDRYYLAVSDPAADAAKLKELEDSARSSLEEAQAHATGAIKSDLTQVIGQLSAAAAPEGPAAARTEALRAIDGKLQDLVDSQSVETLQHRTENDDKAARGHDLIVVTVLPMLLAGLVTGLLLARSITGALTRMGTLIKSIEADRRDSVINVDGDGEIAALTRAIISMRQAVEHRGNTAAARQAELESERARLAQERMQREAELERQQRIARQAQREQLASEFETQVAGIVSTVAQAAQALSTTAANMAASASTATERSRDASAVAEHTSGSSSQIAAGTGELSSSAQSVRENAEQSKSRASLAVKEAADAKAQIDHLVSAARQISGITDLIASVARKTNLLAINARVEAARAGEAGRGFSIVADEVKALASQTHEATADIGKQIQQVNAAAGYSSESLQRLSEVIAGVDQATTAIFAATDAQLASTRQLAQRVSEISSSMGAVAQDIRGAQETAQATEKMSADVVEAASVIDEQAGKLRDQVGQFVLQLRDERALGAADSTAATHSGDLTRLAQVA